MNPSTDLTRLIQALKQGQGEQENFAELYRCCYVQVFQFFTRKKIPPEEARDLTQNTFFSVFRNLKTLRQDEQFESWLFQIARRELYHRSERQRAQKRKGIDVPLESADTSGFAEQASPAASLQTATPNPQELLLAEESRQQVRAALQRLPEQMRLVTELRVHGLAYREIAEQVNISINTVKSQLFQARERLRKEVGGYFKDLPW